MHLTPYALALLSRAPPALAHAVASNEFLVHALQVGVQGESARGNTECISADVRDIRTHSHPQNPCACAAKMLHAVTLHPSMPARSADGSSGTSDGACSGTALAHAATSISRRVSQRGQCQVLGTAEDVGDDFVALLAANGFREGGGLHHPNGSVYYNGVLCDISSSSSSSSVSCSLYMAPCEWAPSKITAEQTHADSAASADVAAYAADAAAADASAASASSFDDLATLSVAEDSSIVQVLQSAVHSADDAMVLAECSGEQQRVRSSQFMTSTCEAADQTTMWPTSTPAPPAISCPSSTRAPISPPSVAPIHPPSVDIVSNSHSDPPVQINPPSESCSAIKRRNDDVAPGDAPHDAGSAASAAKRARALALDFSAAKMLL